MAVALAKKNDLSGGTSTGEAAERFAQKLMDAWGVGDAQCNDGVVLFLSKEPRQVTPPSFNVHGYTERTVAETSVCRIAGDLVSKV